MVEIDCKKKSECWNNVDIVPFDKYSKNDKFLILEKGKPTFFLKRYNKNEFNIKSIAERERNVLAFFNQSELLRTPRLIRADEDYIITRYERDLSDVNVLDAFDEIVDFHISSMNYDSFPSFFRDQVYANDRRVRGPIRVNKYRDLVEVLWNPEEILDFMADVPPERYNALPIILTHGDLHRGNIHKNESGEIIFNDFERSYFDYPTWDIAKSLLDLSYSEVDSFIDRYIDAVKDSIPHISGEKLRELIIGDCLYRILTDSISDRQTDNFKEVAARHLVRDRAFLERFVFLN